MSWDDEYELEYVKFDNPTFEDAVLYDDLEVLYCKVAWDTLEEYTNQWDKVAKRIIVQKYKRYNTKDGQKFELIDMNFYLSLGARLFNALKKFHKDFPKIKNLKIFRIGKKFDIIYHVHHHKNDSK